MNWWIVGGVVGILLTAVLLCALNRAKRADAVIGVLIGNYSDEGIEQ